MKSVKVHAFVPDPSLGRDWAGDPYCGVPGCGRPQRNRVHKDAPEADPAEGRRIGETDRGGDQE